MTNPRALVVDDHRDTLQLFGTYLSFAGFDVTVASSAADALKLLDGTFDVIATDLAMPGMDGVEFIRRVRETYEDRPGPIIAVSGQVNEAARVALETCNCCRLLTKPCDLGEMADTMHALITSCVHDCRQCRDRLGAPTPANQT